MNLKQKIDSTIRNIPDFPKPGIQFKDIMPIFLNQELCNEIVNHTIKSFNSNHIKVDAICAIESRGFFLGTLIANKMNIPMFPIQKKGKLPAETKSFTYNLEYGTETLELHTGVIKPGWNIMIHDDLLATGGTAVAAAELICSEGGQIAGFSFICELDFLKGKERLLGYSNNIISIINY